MIDDLIYDIGMNNGDDTAYYLHKGYRVLAVEANPILVRRCEEKFGPAIEEGRLTILPVGIASQSGSAEFWVNDMKDEWSSFDKTAAARNGLPCHPMSVECVTFQSILEEYGIPYYLKIDIEGNDACCLRGLNPPNLPKYISIESHSLEYLLTLSALGYNGFKCISQVHHNNPLKQIVPLSGEVPGHLVNRPIILGQETAQNRSIASEVSQSSNVSIVDRMLFRFNLRRIPKVPFTPPNHEPRIGTWEFPLGSSGSFGEDAPGEWLSVDQIAFKWLPLRLRLLDLLDADMPPDSWYDFHATILTRAELDEKGST